MTDQRNEQDRKPVDHPRPPRKRYVPPRLIEYGNVGKLTQTGGATRNDMGGMMNRPCI